MTREAQIIVAQRMDTTLDGATRMPNSAPYWQQIVLPINVTKCQKMAAQECSDSPMCFHYTTAFQWVVPQVTMLERSMMSSVRSQLIEMLRFMNITK